MKLNLGKTLLKALKSGSAAAAATALVGVKTDGGANLEVSGLVGLIVGVIQGILNIIKTVRKIKRGEVG